jgi:hypothetical protein
MMSRETRDTLLMALFVLAVFVVAWLAMESPAAQPQDEVVVTPPQTVWSKDEVNNMAEAPDGIALDSGAAVIGYSEVGVTGYEEAAGPLGTSYVDGVPTASRVKMHTYTFTWTEPLGGAADSPARAYSIFLNYNASNGAVLSGHAYLQWVSDPYMTPNAQAQMAIYDPTGTTLLGVSDVVNFGPPSETRWFEFPFSSGVVLPDPRNVLIVVHKADNPDSPLRCAYDLVPVPITASNVAEASGAAELDLHAVITASNIAEVSGEATLDLPPVITVNDRVICSDRDRPTLVSPCLGRYIDIETMLGL